MLGKRVLSFMLSFCLTAVPVTPDTAMNVSQSADKAGEAVTTQENPGGGITVEGTEESAFFTTSSGDSLADGGVDGADGPGAGGIITIESINDAFNCNFQDESIGNWGMTGDLSGNVSIKEDSNESGNKFLEFTTKEIRNSSAMKAFDVPVMTDAGISLKWFTGNLTSTSRGGYAGLKFMDGDKELVTLYINDIRSASESSKIYYTVDGVEPEEKKRKDTGVTAAYNSWHNVSVSFDFKEHKAKLLVDGTETTVDIDAFATRVNQLCLATFDPTGGAKVTTTMGIDDFAFNFTENTGEDTTSALIYSLAELPDAAVTKKDWTDGTYIHPQKIKATLVSGETIEVDINKETWTSDPVFDENKAGWYTWTAEIAAPPEHLNPKGLKVSYKMAYQGDFVSSHDYENDFTFGIWDSVAWGKEMDKDSGTGGFGLTSEKEADGNTYMKASVSNAGGSRGSRLDVSTEIVKGSTVKFDWMPIDASKGNGQVMFLAPDSWNSYFTLNYDTSFNITAYTKCPLGASSTTQKEFEGSVSQDNPIATGMSGQNKWFTVELAFDYINHTADLKIYEKGNEAAAFTEEDIPIDTDANGIKSMAVILRRNSSDRAGTTMGLDNIAIDFDKFADKDIVAVEQPADVMLTKAGFEGFVFPDEITVKLGDGSERNVQLGDWSADPVFDEEKDNVYIWSAPLELGELTNHFNLKASFKMDYTLLPFPLYAHNPNTLELPFGDPLPAEFPRDVIAFFSDGTSGRMAVGEWTPIREFNPEEEGIYVYGAKLVATEGENQVVADQLMKNENHGKYGTQEYTYDVYYRISYFKNNNNYQAYRRSMEYLDRGVYAVKSGDGIFVSWRLLVTEYGEDVDFYIYRNGEQINDTPITTKTNYVDKFGKAGDVYTVVKVQDGQRYESEAVAATEENYMSVPLQKPENLPSKTGEMATYSINDAGVADVDGDGQYEIIVKWYPSNGFDSGQAKKPSSPTIFDVYEMDGTALWRLNMGLEMPSGAHFNQFMFYDMDEDGRAELFLKTSDGTVSYRPDSSGKFNMKDESTIVSYIGDKNVVPGTNIGSNGHLLPNAGNEYVTVFNGATGEEIDTIDYVNTTGNYEDWHAEANKNDGGNRSARYNIAIAYLPREEGSTQTIPAVLFQRGYYSKTTVIAYTLRDGKLTTEWNFVTESRTVYSNKGNHNMSTGDIDNDGFDELVIGAMAIDHDGNVLWVKDGDAGRDFAGHADAIHLVSMTPDSDQLYVFCPQEDTNSTLNYSLSNAANGARIGGNWLTSADIGRGVAANITPMPGFEYWAGKPNFEIPDQVPAGAIYNFYGDVVAQEKPLNFTTNWRMYWDGDLLSELPDSYNPSVPEGAASIFKYNWENNTMDTLATFEGTRMNNWSKNNPSLSADLFGDWREEIMVRNEDDTALRIYMTTDETDYMIYTLMHDPVYRNAVANQNTSYNQPPHLGFYLGEDIAGKVLAMQLPTANITYTTEGQQGQTDKTALKAEVEKAGALKEADYTEASWQVFAAALAEAEAELKKEASTPAAVKAALDKLTAAVEALVEKPDEPDTPDEPGNNGNSGSSNEGSSSGAVSYAGAKADWNKINSDLQSLAAGNEGTALDVITGSNTVVPANILKLVKDKNRTLAMHVSRNVAFSISSSNVTAKAQSSPLNLSLRDTTAIPGSLVNEKQKGAQSVKMIPMKSHESFQMVVNLHMALGAENKGSYANLYRYNSQSSSLEYMGSFQIQAGGQAMFGIHAGADYLVTVTKEKVSEKAVSGSYTVAKGDTLSRIAARYGISLSQLLAANPQIRNSNRITAGEKIYIR